MLQKALGCLFVFGIAPVGIGGLWTKGIGQKREKILNLYLAGFLSELAVFQLIAVPVMVKEVYGMNLLVYLTTAVLQCWLRRDLSGRFCGNAVCGSRTGKSSTLQFKIRSVCFSGCCFWRRWAIRCIWPLPMLPLTGMMRIM